MNTYHQQLIDLQPYLLSYAKFKLKLKPENAEEMVQDTLLAALENEDTPSKHDPKKGELKTWVTTILINKSNTLRKRNKVIEFVPLHLLDENDESLIDYLQDPELKAIEKEAISMVQDILDSLPEVQREAYIHVIVDGLTYIETAEKLNISEKTVDNFIQKTKKQILKEVPNPYR
jgi:RNA polymerase sigma factor (sigma-70 family)